jgi:hypothetical protein
MRKPRLRTPLARAVVPVLAGIAFFCVFFAGLWVAASVINSRATPSSSVANKVFEVGKVESMAKAVAEDGPLLFPDLKSPDGVRSIVLDHTGADPAKGWRVYYGYPADLGPTCLVTHTKGARTFTDCNQRTVTVDQLEKPANVRPIVENKKTLYIDLRDASAPATTLAP